MIPCLPESGIGRGIETTLAHWVTRNWLRPLDAAFAGFLLREHPQAQPLLILAAALASHQLGRGHVCLDLAAVLADPRFVLSLPPEEGSNEEETPAQLLTGVDLPDWLAACDCPALVGLGLGEDEGEGATPLVLVGHRLYLRRYWRYERQVEAAIGERLGQSVALPAEALRTTLDALFPDAGSQWQKQACALAAGSAFAVITGGPGTGKTTAVVRLLALLQSLALAAGEAPLRIRLAAPTGKAAARLNASIAGALMRLPLAAVPGGEALREAIPATVTTLHRLLGSRPDSRQFRHHADNLLALDLLVVDEASMVDLEMMAALLAALPASARLILLGDRDQLASVEAGAVLGELCRRALAGHYTPTTAAWLQAATGIALDDSLIDDDGTPLDQAIVMLRHSHRFGADSGIGQLAAAVNAGDVAGVESIWKAGFTDILRLDLQRHADGLARLITDGDSDGGSDGRHGYRHYLETIRSVRPGADADDAAFDQWAQAVLLAHGEFQMLCAPRQGPWGVDGLNQLIADTLLAAGLIEQTEGWYEGRPVLVTRNDYGLGLVNGDIGITLRRGERLMVTFADGDRTRWLLPSRLQAVETVFALTVHKSQGSEFGHAALLLPDRVSPLLTRELLYTGITRARRYLTLAEAGGSQVMTEAIRRRVIRASGLWKSSGLAAANGVNNHG